jgi:hypothetical protein
MNEKTSVTLATKSLMRDFCLVKNWFSEQLQSKLKFVSTHS